MALAIDFHFCWIAVDFCYLDCSWFDGGLRLVSVEYLYIISNWGSGLPVWPMTLDPTSLIKVMWSWYAALVPHMMAHESMGLGMTGLWWWGRAWGEETNLNCTVSFLCAIDAVVAACWIHHGCDWLGWMWWDGDWGMVVKVKVLRFWYGHYCGQELWFCQGIGRYRKKGERNRLVQSLFKNK